MIFGKVVADNNQNDPYKKAGKSLRVNLNREKRVSLQDKAHDTCEGHRTSIKNPRLMFRVGRAINRTKNNIGCMFYAQYAEKKATSGVRRHGDMQRPRRVRSVP